MPASTALSSYTFRIREISTGKYVKMNEVIKHEDINKNKKEDALITVNSFLKYYESNTADEDIIKKLFKIDNHQSNNNFKTEFTEYRVISGIVKSGSYGYESDIVQKKGGTVSHHRTSEEAELLPFYFLVAIPDKTDQGIVILQSFMQYGIKKIFTESFDKYFKADKPEYEIVIKDLIPEDLFKYLLKRGKVSKLIYTQFDLGVDIADAYDKKDHNEKEIIKLSRKRKAIEKEDEKKKIKAEYILTDQTGIISTIIKSLDNKIPYQKGQPEDPLKKLIEITSFKHFDYDTIKIQVRTNGKYRIIDLGHLDEMRPYINITEEIKYSLTGHPDFDSINSYAIDLFKDLAKGLGV